MLMNMAAARMIPFHEISDRKGTDAAPGAAFKSAIDATLKPAAEIMARDAGLKP